MNELKNLNDSNYSFYFQGKPIPIKRKGVYEITSLESEGTYDYRNDTFDWYETFTIKKLASYETEDIWFINTGYPEGELKSVKIINVENPENDIADFDTHTLMSEIRGQKRVIHVIHFKENYDKDAILKFKVKYSTKKHIDSKNIIMFGKDNDEEYYKFNIDKIYAYDCKKVKVILKLKKGTFRQPMEQKIKLKDNYSHLKNNEMIYKRENIIKFKVIHLNYSMKVPKK